MRITRRRPAIVFFITLGVVMVAVAVALNITWVILNASKLIWLLLGIPFFAVLIAGLILNTIFLVREVRRNERQDSFLNAVTHELKTPIASIRLYVETLQRRQLSEEQRQEFYAILLSDSDRLLATVEQVLKAGEVGQRTRNPVWLAIDMKALTEDAIAATCQRYHLSPTAVQFEVGGQKESLVVHGNYEELRTAVLNILDNAVKYSPQNLEVAVELRVENDAWVIVSVSDHGVGIPPTHLKRIFKRFYRVPSMSTLKVKGTGLGLFLVRTIARQHGGDASAESAGEGKGTTVRLQLPRWLSTPVERLS